MKRAQSIQVVLVLVAVASACGDSSSEPDTGTDPFDGGPPPDAGLDAGPTPDAGLDAGPMPDAAFDAGPTLDAAPDDASTDGGTFLAPVCYHPLDDVAGTLADQMGAYDLDDITGTLTYGEPGQVGSAMSFRAGGLAASTELYAARGDVSVSLWLKTDAAEAPGMRQRIWAWGISIPSRFVLSMAPDGQLQVYVERSGNGLLNHTLNLATGNLADGNWHHVVLHRERIPDPAGTNRVDAFVDGAVTPVSDQAPDGEDFEFHNSQPFALGAGTGNAFQGSLDEIAFFDYELSEAERQAAWMRGSAGQPLLE